MYKTILAALDGSTLSDKALATACNLAKMNQSNLHLIYVSAYQQAMVAVGGVYMVPKDDFEKPGMELLDHAVKTANNLGLSNVETHLSSGSIGSTITETAKKIGADLIVLGSQGHSDVFGLLLGSVSHKVSNSADCSCLIVR